MRIWNLFEQSGHFKDVEAEMGYDGVDVDCVKTDHTDYVMDLLAEMDKWERGEKSIFDDIKKDDFVFSFFPCIRFENAVNYDSKPVKKIINERGINRSLISKEFIRVFLSEIVDLEGEVVDKKYD